MAGGVHDGATRDGSSVKSGREQIFTCSGMGGFGFGIAGFCFGPNCPSFLLKAANALSDMRCGGAAGTGWVSRGFTPTGGLGLASAMKNSSGSTASKGPSSAFTWLLANSKWIRCIVALLCRLKLSAS